MSEKQDQKSIYFHTIYGSQINKNNSLKIIKSHTVPEGIQKIRLSDYINDYLDFIPSKNGIKKAIKRGEILINGKISITGMRVEAGQRIDLTEAKILLRKVYSLKLDIVFEDEHIAIINKPGGVSVSGFYFQTIENALLHNISKSNEYDALSSPKPVHRLDNQTSGLLIVAKTKRAQIFLGQSFENKEIEKRYRAIVIGKTPDEGEIKSKIEDKDSYTGYTLVKQIRSLKNEYLSLLDLYPKTGRTHQLRVHMSDSGFPILGDKLYGKEGLILIGKGLFLCSVELVFNHPTDGKKTKIIIDQPSKFNSLLKREQRRWEKYNK